MRLPPENRTARRASPWARAGGIRPAINIIPSRTDTARRPSPRRLRRVTDRWMQIGHSSLMARIVVFELGGHARPVITRGSEHLRFSFVSSKTNSTQLGEGKGEQFLAYLNEVAADVVDYECHPFEFHILVDGKVRRYRPDSWRQLDDGTVELIEVKRTPDDMKDPDYRETLAMVAEICRLCGWVFRDLYLEDIIGDRPRDNPRALPQRVHNVEALFGRRSLELNRHENRVAGRTVARGTAIAWGDLRDELAPTDPLQGDAVIERLLAAGLLATDLDLKFGPGTVLAPRRPFTGISSIRL